MLIEMLILSFRHGPLLIAYDAPHCIDMNKDSFFSLLQDTRRRIPAAIFVTSNINWVISRSAPGY